MAKLGGLALLYGLVILFGNTHAWSGSDAGGKAATVKVMAESGRWDLDVGYWAADADPDGRFHPLIKTTRYGDHWAQGPAVALVYAAVPLWKLGGPAAILLLPVAGSLLAAWSARQLARNLGSEDGWWAFWLVGIGTPVLFYAGDFWEHAPGLGLSVFVIASVTRTELTVKRAALVGAAAGLAVVLRAETAVYFAAVGVALLAVRDTRQWWAARWRVGAVAGVVAVAVFGVNSVLERAALGTAVQADRLATQASVAGSGVGQRAEDSALTAFGLVPETTNAAYFVAALFVGGLLVLGIALRTRREGIALRATVAAGAGVAIRVASGLGFVPGTFSAAPAAAAGLANATTNRARAVAFGALGALPLVWLVQWQGNLVAQWGGRYTLLTGVLLTVVAAVALEAAPRRSLAVVAVLVCTAVVAVLGAAWRVDRTNGIVTAVEGINEAPDDVVVVSTLPHLGREGGAFYGDQRWLRLDRRRDADDLDAVLVELDVDEIDLVEDAGSSRAVVLPSYQKVSERRVPYLLGVELRVTRMRLVGS